MSLFPTHLDFGNSTQEFHPHETLSASMKLLSSLSSLIWCHITVINAHETLIKPHWDWPYTNSDIGTGTHTAVPLPWHCSENKTKHIYICVSVPGWPGRTVLLCVCVWCECVVCGEPVWLWGESELDRPQEIQSTPYIGTRSSYEFRLLFLPERGREFSSYPCSLAFAL
jgi:hypothetical protein